MAFTAEALCALSEKRTYSIEDINWAQGVSPSSRWLPEAINPVSFLPSYAKLSEEEKLLINQYYAAGLSEKFILFENALSLSLSSLLETKKNIPSDIVKMMKIFISEENKHSAMFARMNNLALPEKYKDGEFYFLEPSFKYWVFNNVLFKKPSIFLVWLWLGAYFEEKTLMISKAYHAERKTLDPLFCEVHKFHLKDEARHVEMDRFFFEYFYKKHGGLKKKLSRYMAERIFKSITVPNKTLKKIFSCVVEDLNIKNEKVYSDMRREAEGLPQNKDFMAAYFSKKDFPVFHDLMDGNEEAKSLESHFV